MHSTILNTVFQIKEVLDLLAEVIDWLSLPISYGAILFSAIYFTIAFFTDLFYSSIPNLRLCFICYVFAALRLILCFQRDIIISHLVGSVAFFALLFIFAKYFSLGGGDALSIPILAILWGTHDAAIVVLVGCILTTVLVVVRAISQNKNLSSSAKFPMLPGVSVCYLGYLVSRFFI